MNKTIFIILLNLMVLISSNDDEEDGPDEDNSKSPYPNGHPDPDKPGFTSCIYLGDTNHENCKSHPMSVAKLPPECTSFFYDGLLVVSEAGKVEIGLVYEWDAKDRIKALCDTGKNVYLLYGHENLGEWVKALEIKDQAENEISVLKGEYLKEFKIKGLVLDSIVENDTDTSESFSCNLKNYITTFKKEIPGLQIALNLVATSLLMHDGKKSKSWLDFQDISKVVDFFVVNFKNFNQCAPDYVHTGIIPMDGKGNTLNKLLKALKDLNIPKEKTYFEFLVSPTPNYDAGVHGDDGHLDGSLPPCFIRYTKICENKFSNIDKWCADTSCTLRDKGKFAKENGAGIIARSIDAIDRNIKCECYNSKYPAFFFLLDGYYNMFYNKTCKKFDRQFD